MVFTTPDECARYRITCHNIKPALVPLIPNLFEEVFAGKIERCPNYKTFADEAAALSLSFSITRIEDATWQGNSRMNKSL